MTTDQVTESLPSEATDDQEPNVSRRLVASAERLDMAAAMVEVDSAQRKPRPPALLHAVRAGQRNYVFFFHNHELIATRFAPCDWGSMSIAIAAMDGRGEILLSHSIQNQVMRMVSLVCAPELQLILAAGRLELDLAA